MSRGQEGQTFNTASGNSAADQTTATKDNALAQEGIGNYETALAKFSASDPYGEGGAYETAENQGLAQTAGASGDAAREQLGQQAQRTGQNMAGANATAASLEDQSERNLAGQQAAATADRLGKKTQFGQTVLGASEVPATLEAGLAGQSFSAANGSLNTAASAGQTPSFWDQFGSSVASGLGKIAVSGGGA